MKKLRKRIFIIIITLIIVIVQLTSNSYMMAKENSVFQVSQITKDSYSSTLELKNISENIQKVQLRLNNKLLQTKDNTENVTFDTYSNGTYEIVGLDHQGNEIEKESFQVHSFKNLYLEKDPTTHVVKIISRYAHTNKVSINDEEEVHLYETHPGLYEGVYKLEKSGSYTFRVLDFNQEEMAREVVQYDDVAHVNSEGKIVLSNENDLKLIASNPSGSYILDADIELTKDWLVDVDFTGSIDGQGYRIRGIKEHVFNSIKNATIQNIVIEGMLAKTSIASTIVNSGFYVQAEDEEKDFALILNSENTSITNSFAFMNVEGKTVSGFILEGTGTITNSYVSGYLKGKEVYGFGKEVDIKNSYITASLTGEERVLFSNGTNEACFYDAQINDLEDAKATPYFTKDITSGTLKQKEFLEIAGSYPQVKNVETWKLEAQKVAAMSVIAVESKNNLSTLQEDTITIKEDTDNEKLKDMEWDSERANKKGTSISLNADEGEVSATQDRITNRFALRSVATLVGIKAGDSTTYPTTQITYPITIGAYYKVIKSQDGVPTLPANHKAAIDAGWKIMYWSGSYTQGGLEWNSDYALYRTDLKTLTNDGTSKTNYGKNGGTITLTGTYDFNETMTATLSNTNTTKGTLYWESAATLDKTATWSEIKQTKFDGSKNTDTYQVTTNEASQHLRVRFVADDTTGFQGTLIDSTEAVIKQEITSVTIENKTNSNGTYTVNDKLIANMTPVGKENEVIFQWFQEGQSEVEPIATGRNYQIKSSDINKKLYVRAVAKTDGDFKNNKDSIVTKEVSAIHWNTPVAKDHLTVVGKDDITVTLTMATSEGLYRYGYTVGSTANLPSDIIAYPILGRNNTNTTLTGLTPNTTYYFYVQQVGENGYSDSAWSNDSIKVITNQEAVKGDVVITGENVYKKTLTASIKNNPSSQTGQFIWYRLDSNGKREETPLATNTTTYSLTQADIGKKIEVAYAGNGNYSGEVSNITEIIAKEEIAAPTSNVTYIEKTDTSITLKMPTNINSDRYILGVSNTKDGVPIERLDNNAVVTYPSGGTYILSTFDRDTTYHFFVRYAENATHQKSDWTSVDKVVSVTTNKKNFEGGIGFHFENGQTTPMQGHSIKAELLPKDSSFNNKGTWTWTKIFTDGTTEVIDNFTIISYDNGHIGTEYLVPRNEPIGTKYKITYEANLGYSGSVEGTSAGTVAIAKVKYDKPNPNHISMEAIDDSSVKVKMTQGAGRYRFWYKKADSSTWESFLGTLNTLLNDPEDGYRVAELSTDTGVDVTANTDVIISGLERNTAYTIRVQRVEDDDGAASDYAYSSDKTSDKTVTTKKTNIAGYVSIGGTTRYNETLTATYHTANYASTGNGSDAEGAWQWYRGTTKISGATSKTYKLVKEDVGQILKATYTMPSGHSFTGSLEANTTEVKKAINTNLKVDTIADKELVSGKRTLEVKINEDASKIPVYYRLQKESETAPTFPNSTELSTKWQRATSSTITIDQDANKYALEPNVTYVIYLIKTEDDTTEASSIATEKHKIGTYQQTGTIAFTALADNKQAFVIGQSVKANLSQDNNASGTWKWYMSVGAYGSTITSMPSITDASKWKQINEGYSQTSTNKTSELKLTEDMFGHYIRAEFVADDKKYSGTIRSSESQYVKKIYEETISISSSTKDGYGNYKAYANSVITGTINNYVESGTINRATVRFKIGSSYVVPSITNGAFQYVMPNNASYDGQEITAEVSTPKTVGLYVDSNLKNLTTNILNSKTSTSTSMKYTYGIPISNANDLENFMKATSPYSDRSSNSVYVLTNNINMSSKSKITYSETAFAGKLNGDYHTIVGQKNPFFANLTGTSTKNAIVTSIIFLNANIDTLYLGTDVTASGSIITRQADYASLSQIMLIDSSVKSGRDSGFLIGLNLSNPIQVEQCFSAGGSVYSKSSGGGMVGFLGNEIATKASVVRHSYSIGTSVEGEHRGGLVGGGNGKTENVYAASPITAVTTLDGGVKSIHGDSNIQSITNSFYDSTISPNSGLSSVQKGTSKSTSDMIGTKLQTYLGNENWVYSNGYYPRLKWVSDKPIAKLYSATRGAFISVDNSTSPDDMFNGNIKGSIQIPTELQTKDFTVSSSNSSILKVTDSGTIIPVGAVGQKAIITIKYTEPDQTIGGTASNTFEFTVGKTLSTIEDIYIRVAGIPNLIFTNPDSSAPEISRVLQATSSPTGSSFQWYRRKNGTTVNEPISGATTAIYTVKPADLGYEISVLIKANGRASAFSKFTKPVVSLKPTPPSEKKKSDNSITINNPSGESTFQYEYGYTRADENGIINLVEGNYGKDTEVTISNLQRNKTYKVYVRIAAASDNSYPASAWSDATSITTTKTSVVGKPKLGTAVNVGSSLSLMMETTNGQTGTWSLQRMSSDGNTKVADISFSSNANETSYTLTTADIGYRIKAVYTGTGDFIGTAQSDLSEVIQKSSATKPNAPLLVSKTSSTMTVEMNEVGNYDIAYSDSPSGEKKIVKTNLASGNTFEMTGLAYNRDYYVFARKSETASAVASPWSDYTNIKTLQFDISGGSSNPFGTLKVDEFIRFYSRTYDVTADWVLERVTTSNGISTYTTISKSEYTISDINHETVLQYKINPKDGNNKLRATLTGNGNFTGSFSNTTNSIANASQELGSNIPVIGYASGTDDSLDLEITGNPANYPDIYQLGYTIQGGATNTIKTVDATGPVGTKILIDGLKRNTSYDIYIRKAAKTGYEPSSWVKSTTQGTEKTTLKGSIEHCILEGTTETPAKVGIAKVGTTYKAKYIPGTYAQTGDDSTAGTFQWYANDVAIPGATTDTYTIEPREGNVEITVKYTAKDTSDFQGTRTASIGTLTKPVYDAPATLPIVKALGEDGNAGSRLSVNGTVLDNVYYYVQKASVGSVPATIVSSVASKNEVKVGQWFKASANMILYLEANTEYVVFAARLEDGSHVSSGVISQRAVKTVKENLSLMPGISITEADTTNWKVLQDKQLRISNAGKAVDGVWQYYVSQSPSVENSWQNITAEVKVRSEEGKTNSYAYTRVIVPLKYNGYYVRAVFTGRENYEGSKTYTSSQPLIGTQIKGRATISAGNTSEVFVPIEVKYIYAKDADGNDIVDEANGTWTWYREITEGSNTYEQIDREQDTVGMSDSYTPTAADVGKKLYAVYTGARDNIYSGSVESSKLQNVKRAPQNKPEALQVKQVNGTSVQIVLPTNMIVQGKTIAQPRLEYRIRGASTWIKNGEGDAWLNNLKANTAYEVRVCFEGTSEYEPSVYGDTIIVTTSNQSFDIDNLTLEEPVVLESGGTITATFKGKGYDEGYFIIKRSDGVILQDKVQGTVKNSSFFTSGSRSIEYICGNGDVGKNIIIQFQANVNATTFGGVIEKTSTEVLKPYNPIKAGTPVLETIQYSEETLKVKVNDAFEYVLNESVTAIDPASSDWVKLSKDAGSDYHTFENLSKEKSYYLHVRNAENATYRYSDEDVSASTSPWASTQYTITYENMDGATNGNPTNPTQYTEITPEITLNDAIKSGFTFNGWTTAGVATPTKKLKILLHSSGNKTFKADWTKNIYTITYNLDDGLLETTNPATYDVESADFTLTNPTKRGYTFQGWKNEETAVVSDSVEIKTGTTGNLTYTAIWEKITYKVTFDTQGGEDIPQGDVKFKEHITKPTDPVMQGFQFSGWFKESMCVNEWNFDNDVVEDTMTLYAKWIANKPVKLQEDGYVISIELDENVQFYDASQTTYDADTMKYDAVNKQLKINTAFTKWNEIYFSSPIQSKLHLGRIHPVLQINDENFPDEAFQWSVKKQYDKDNDDTITMEEITKITNMDLDTSGTSYKLDKLRGIEYFFNLEELSIRSSEFKELDLNETLIQNIKLKTLLVNIASNGFETMDISRLERLEAITIESYGTSSFILPIQAPNLTSIRLLSLTLTKLELGEYPQLKTMEIMDVNDDINYDEKRIPLDLSSYTNLETLYLYIPFESITLGTHNLLTEIVINSRISSLDVSQVPNLTSLQLSDNSLTSLDISNLTLMSFYGASQVVPMQLDYEDSIGWYKDIEFSGNVSFPNNDKVHYDETKKRLLFDEPMTGSLDFETFIADSTGVIDKELSGIIEVVSKGYYVRGNNILMTQGQAKAIRDQNDVQAFQSVVTTPTGKEQDVTSEITDFTDYQTGKLGSYKVKHSLVYDLDSVETTTSKATDIHVIKDGAIISNDKQSYVNGTAKVYMKPIETQSDEEIETAILTLIDPEYGVIEVDHVNVDQEITNFSIDPQDIEKIKNVSLTSEEKESIEITLHYANSTLVKTIIVDVVNTEPSILMKIPSELELQKSTDYQVEAASDISIEMSATAQESSSIFPGKFSVKSDPYIHLYVDGDESKEAFLAQMFDENNNWITVENPLVMSLQADNKVSAKGIIKAFENKSLPIGKYSGVLKLILSYDEVSK